MKGRIIHTGSVIVDVVMTVEAVPAPGEDVVASSTRLEAGGALNSIVAATRNGAEVVFAGLVGTGPMADIVSRALSDCGITHLFPRVLGIDNGFTVAMIDATAERTFVTSLGAEDEWSADHVVQVPVTDDVVYVSGYSLASERGTRAVHALVATLPDEAVLVFDPSPLVADLPTRALEPILSRASVLTANAREVRLLAGIEDFDAAAEALATRWPHAAVVARNGAAGCVLHREGHPVARVAAPSVVAHDTSGAGDTHCGVMMAALATGSDLETAVLRATIAAAIAVTRSGPATAPTAVEIDAALAENGARSP